MPRAALPNKDACISYVLAHPEVSYAEAAKLYGVPPATVAVWIQRERKKRGELAVPKRSTDGSKNKPPKVPTLVTLPAPPPPKVVLPEDCVTLAQAAVRKRLKRLASDEVVNAESSKEMRETMAAVVAAYEVFPQLDPGTAKKSSGSSRFVSALLGRVPEDDDGEAEPEDQAASQEER